MRKVNAIIEKASDGNYSIYMDDNDMPYLVTGTGKTVEEARKVFEDGYEDIKKYYAETGEPFEEVEFCYQYDIPSFRSMHISSRFRDLKKSPVSTRNNSDTTSAATGIRPPRQPRKSRTESED